MNAMNAFRQEIERAGLLPGEVAGDGTLQRCGTLDKPQSRDGWYTFHGDHPASGAFGNWRTGTSETWTATNGAPLAQAEKDKLKCRIEADRAAREKAQAERNAEAAAKAREILKAASPCPEDHAYLQKKGIPPLGGVRVGQDGAMLLPLMDVCGRVQGLQRIFEDGNKRFLSGMKKAGHFGVIAGDKDRLFVVEGFATGASIHLATGGTVLVALDCGNLLAVARLAREKYPKREIIIAGDDDLRTKGNPGRTEATAAARAINAMVVFPLFADIDGAGSDFNDLMVAESIEVVKAQLAQAKAIDTQSEPPMVKADIPGPTMCLDDEWAPATKTWPKLSERAMPGIVGDFVRLATRNSEADPAAVLATFLTRFGAEVSGHAPGAGPSLMVGDGRHKPRLFACIVGDSAKSRKGTSAQPTKKLFTFDDETYTPATTSPGPLSSGEGLVFAVRDEVKEWKVGKQPGEDGAWVVSDPGETDKRLFVLDEELAAALHSTKRTGNTLSTTMRCLWDDGDVSPLTKSNRIKTTGANVCLVAHITIAELKDMLDNVQVLNGFGNRFLWVCSRRQRLVPFPQPMEEVEINHIRREVLRLIRLAQGRGRITMGNDVRVMWESAYPELSRAHPGLSGCIINRGEAQTLRLAMIYALLDGQDSISTNHLASALAFWGYCRESAQLIFGEREADPIAEKVLDALKGGPRTTTELHNALGNHYNADRLKATLEALAGDGRVLVTQEQTGGRPKTRFSLCEKSELSEISLPTPDLNSLSSLNSHGSGQKMDSLTWVAQDIPLEGLALYPDYEHPGDEVVL